MTQKEFLIQLAIVTVVAAAIVFGLNTLDKLRPYQIFSWICLAFFVLFSVLMFFMGTNASKSANKNDFTNVALGFTAGKMFGSLMIIVFYIKLIEPSSKMFILPFFVIYIVFTAFETYFMMRLGKANA